MIFFWWSKILYGQAEDARFWNEKLQNGFLYRVFVAIKVDPYLFMYKIFCVVHVYDCLFWERSQYNIDKFMKYFREDKSSYNWEHSKGLWVSELLGIDIKTLNNGVF